MNYNRVIIAGNLVRDPELRQTQSGASVASFTVAINERQKDGSDRTSFITCDSFGRMAENIERYFKKGKPIFVEGKLRQETWEDKQGNKQSKTKVFVERFEFITSGERTQTQENGANSGVSSSKGINTPEDDYPPF